MAGLEAIHQAIRACVACNLHVGRTNAVPGEGSPTAGIMFVGEGPGYNEDRQGRPFVGAAGQFLNELLASIGLRREDVFITNMVKCRPPNNRDPFPGELEACTHYLDEQITEIQPKIVVPLGRHALSHWYPNESISRVRAKPKAIGRITLFPLYHPAAALHNGGLRATIEEDFGKLGALLASLNDGPAPAVTPARDLREPNPSLLDAPRVTRDEPPAASATSEGPSDEPPAKQLSMF